MAARFEELGLGELRDLAEGIVLVAVASEAGIFEALASGPRSAAEVAAAEGYDERATRVVLQALEELDLVRAEGDRFRASERCLRELCDPQGEDYQGRGLPHWLRALRGRTRLGEVLERGGPLEARAPRRSPEAVVRFTSAMAAAPRERMERIAELCLERRPEARTVLDLGGGTGNLMRAFLDRGLGGTLLDAPEVVEHVVEAYGLGALPGLAVVAGDFTRDPLPVGPFDLVVLSNVLHIYGPATVADVIARAAARLAPGGVLAVADSMRGASSRAGYIAIQMLLRSAEGGAYAPEEIVAWMEAAGLTGCRVTDVDGLRQLVTGVREG